MQTLTYMRLTGFTAGTLLQLFWMVVILGYRRQRNFERVFFFLCLALFFFYAGSLLALNAQIFYTLPPQSLASFAALLIGVGLTFLPPVLFHMHVEFAATRGSALPINRKRVALGLVYLPAFYFLILVLPASLGAHNFDFTIPGNSLGIAYVLWLFLLILLSFTWEWKFAREMAGQPEQKFHQIACVVLVGALLLLGAIHFPVFGLARQSREALALVLSLMALPPFVALIYFVQRHNFLNIGRQKNLLYAVSATFVALLYLALVRRISEWFAPILPPEATAAVLLFLLVVFIEPLQRLLGRRLQETAQREMDRVQRLMTLIQQEARQGNRGALVQFIEQKTKQEFELESAKLGFVNPASAELRLRSRSPQEMEELEAKRKAEPVFGLRRMGVFFGYLRVKPHGSAISGETMAALESLSEQLPSALDVCQLIGDKLQLERELAERERLALVGQMAASISHNLKNPLGSIKTILQVQLENPEMPDSMRVETKMVLEEISRLSTKLNQLLQFSRPAVRAGNGAVGCDPRAVMEEAASVLRPQAEKRGISLRLELAMVNARVAVAAEALNDIASNLLVNALEAVSAGSSVAVSGEVREKVLVLFFEDNGPGIPESLREKILQPFFTTKSQGTGLGLAIVARRIAECDGKLSWQSPVRDGRGTRFEVTLPLAQEA
ncbi:MAG TPA: ATP-binding protein [Candidatus Dormibacteraeota bacterium]|jgi:signal transduction histidine kinase|nr:ATP-binding protein [Candidatus Dormibacteraeota bacterium]